MSDLWQEFRLGDVAEATTGFPFKSAEYTDDQKDPVLVGGDNIGQGVLRWTNVRRWPRTKLTDMDPFWILPGDVVLAMDRPWIDAGLKRARLRATDNPALLVQRTARLRGTPVLDTTFLYYVISSAPFTQYLRRVQTGTAIPHISLAQIRAFSFRMPPIREQRAIAAILGALDDKIELNRKMNETLEQMAKAIFKSWFIDFDGHTQFEDSELGRIPKGWRPGNLPDLIEFNPHVSIRKGHTAPYIDMKALSTGGATISGAIPRPLSGGSKFENGDTLLARITPCLENGKTGFVDLLPAGDAGWGSTEFIVMRGRRPVPPQYVYCVARSPVFRAFVISQMTGTSGRQRVPNDCFEHCLWPIPPEDTLANFESICAPIFARLRLNADESRTLAELRDTLLPKLISGELRIKDAERLAEQVV